jgi:membrane associated rhomboid family serine protease
MSRSRELLRSIPFTTLGILGLCISVYILQCFMDLELQQFTLCPRLILYLHEYYRIITSTLFHANLMHIGMNMMSTSAISSLLEKRLGTLRHLFSTLWAILLTSFLYIAISLAGYHLLGYTNLMNQHSVGFSGIIFHMSVLECNMSPTQARSLFGVASVPAYLYPWALLVLLQFIMPNLSFLGHLVGIMTGTLQHHGLFEYIMVNEAYLQEMETTWPSLQWLVHRPNFIATPSGSSHFQQDPAFLLRSWRKGFWMATKLVRDVVEFVLVFLFGRGGRMANVNGRIFGSSRSTSSSTSLSSPSSGGVPLGSGVGDFVVEGIEDDDDWVGLPPMPAPDTISRLV